MWQEEYGEGSKGRVEKINDRIFLHQTMGQKCNETLLRLRKRLLNCNIGDELRRSLFPEYPIYISSYMIFLFWDRYLQ
jgi:hypothetical protein